MRTFSSKNYKIVHINSKMTTADFISKVAKISNVCKELICVTYDFSNNEVDKVEIEERDNSSLLHTIVDGKRVVRPKEVISEQLKREMG